MGLTNWTGAELQAMNRKPMYMAEWIVKLDDFLKLSDREILQHAGKVSHADAVEKAEREYDRFANARAAVPAAVERHFDEAARAVKSIEEATGRSDAAKRRPRRGDA